MVISKLGHKCTSLLWIWRLQSQQLLDFRCSWSWSLFKLLLKTWCNMFLRCKDVYAMQNAKNLSLCVIPAWYIWKAGSYVTCWWLLAIRQSEQLWSCICYFNIIYGHHRLIFLELVCWLNIISVLHSVFLVRECEADQACGVMDPAGCLQMAEETLP